MQTLSFFLWVKVHTTRVQFRQKQIRYLAQAHEIFESTEKIEIVAFLSEQNNLAHSDSSPFVLQLS